MKHIIPAILFAMLLPIALNIVQYTRIKALTKKRRDTDEAFVIQYPEFGGVVGIITCAMIYGMMLLFTVFSKEPQHWLLYVISVVFSLPFFWLTFKVFRWKVEVKKEQITVKPVIMRPYTFCFEDIVSVKREVTKRRVEQQERVLVKTNIGKKIYVEVSTYNYHRFIGLILQKVSPEKLIGFETYTPPTKRRKK